MILFLYNLALFAALVVSAPWWLFRMATTHKYREGLLERLGWVRRLKGANGRPLIWIHAVSVGEVLAISRLVKTLDAALPGHFVAISTTTRTGQELARQRFGTDHFDRVFYCPLDLPWAVGAHLNRLQPAMLVLAETEFWPNLLQGCFRRGIPVAVVNARISDRSWPRYRRLRSLWRSFLSQVTAVLAQSETDAERLRSLGCDPVTVAGNLKFDVRAESDSEAVRLLKARLAGSRLLVAGSTLDGEETMLLAAWSELLQRDSVLVLVLAPRHPERFAEVAGLLERSGFTWRRRTSLSDVALAPLVPGEIVLLDSIGELASVYSLASVAFIGGSLVAAGGHNPLEPAQFAVPTVIGEHYANFKAIVESMRAQNAITVVSSDQLASTLVHLLMDPEAAVAMGQRALRVFGEHSGATDLTVAALREILSKLDKLGKLDKRGAS
jgi:3-deoxy-D-manno-octulosonic-acid transferase